MASLTSASQVIQRLSQNVGLVIHGKSDTVALAVVALVSGGHILLEDVPGVGKTILGRALAKSIGGSFARVQCTPDLLPSDLIGVTIYNQHTGEFDFRPGPIFHNTVLVDEINRTTPKTQSALLECMEERQVTVNGQHRPLAEPFLVIATENPIEYRGTFALPEAQLDRFFVKLTVGYPSAEAEESMLNEQRLNHPIERLQQVVSQEELLVTQQTVRTTTVNDRLREYIVKVVQQTRQHPNLVMGASPRGSLALYRASQAWAVSQQRDYVIPDDIVTVAVATLAHRVITTDHHSKNCHNTARETINDIIKRTAIPK